MIKVGHLYLLQQNCIIIDKIRQIIYTTYGIMCALGGIYD